MNEEYIDEILEREELNKEIEEEKGISQHLKDRLLTYLSLGLLSTYHSTDYETIAISNELVYEYSKYNNDKPGAASLIVIHTQEHQKEEEYILLIKNYRVFIDQELWELPRGFANIDDPNSWSGALREILEETGIDLTSHTYKSQNLGEVYTDTGLTNSKVVLYRIDLFCKEESLDFHNIDKDEMICGYKLVSTKQISSISKDIHDSFTLCALAKAFL